ncbi:MAG: hypothetical protein A2010_10985 [Nitrospirae bacterium GWD2_57_9]|nr:MAG: hypothetical protein A2010_10985 [Nitrospirae bacterium GWD2_57_9]OGW47712.1 MAG: hypothetical protein A2078_05890 [Nitrospirae bacterium GWC2_57_9]
MRTNGDIAITGVGVVSPVGAGRDAYWEALFRGTSGIRPITLFDAAPYPLAVAGEITDFDPLPILGKKGLRDLDRSTRLLCSAAKMALEDSGLTITEESTHATGVSVGATYGSLHSISQFDRSGLIEGPRAVNPSHFPNTVLNSPASQVSIRFRIKGFNTTISTGFCAGLDAVSYAADFIKTNRADSAVAGGVEELCEETFLYFHHLGYLSGAGGPALSCPFDARRNGIIPGEGAAVLVLEREEQAATRGTNVLAKVLGCGNCFDPFADGSFDSAGRGLATAIQNALRNASLTPEDIDYVCSAANSTRGLDRMETKVLKQVFGQHCRKMPVSSIKSMIGESYSASGAMALAAAVGALQRDLIPPTANYRDKDPDCDLDCVPGPAREAHLRHVLVVAADPYGANSAVILGR